MTLVINKHEDITKIIDIFTKYPLQSTKWLNFCDFTQCFELISNKVSDRLEVNNKILDMKE